jgi:hypothetical protein
MHISWQRSDQKLTAEVIKAEGPIIAAVCHGSSSGIVYASSRQIKNQKKLLVYEDWKC